MNYIEEACYKSFKDAYLLKKEKGVARGPYIVGNGDPIPDSPQKNPLLGVGYRGNLVPMGIETEKMSPRRVRKDGAGEPSPVPVSRIPVS